MKQDYFEERLKGILEEGEEHPFDKRQWRRLDQRLREADQPAMPFWLRWLPVAFLLLLGASAWQHFTLSRQIEALEASLLTDKQADKNVAIRTTVVYDTVYIRTTVQETPSVTQAGNRAASGSLPAVLPILQRFSTGPHLRGFTSSGNILYPVAPGENGALETGREGPNSSAANRTGLLGQGFQEYRQRQLFEGADNKRFEEVTADKLDGVSTLPAEPLALLGGKPFSLPTFSALAASPYSYPKPSLFQRLKPKTYALSAGIGGSQESSFLQSDHGWQAGLGLTLGFGKRLGFHLGADYLSSSFILREDAVEDFEFPTVSPREEEDELESIAGNPLRWQFPVGLRIKVLRRGDFTVFAEGGGIATLAIPTQLRYTFETEDNAFYDIFTDDGRTKAPGVDAWYVSLGLRYDWGQQWGAQLVTTRQQSFGDFTFAYEPLDFLAYRLSGVWRW